VSIVCFGIWGLGLGSGVRIYEDFSSPARLLLRAEVPIEPMHLKECILDYRLSIIDLLVVWIIRNRFMGNRESIIDLSMKMGDRTCRLIDEHAPIMEGLDPRVSSSSKPKKCGTRNECVYYGSTSACPPQGYLAHKKL